ncbi:MAG TPA: helix-turn-helix transcriptional regulator [Gemmatimonadaceae bacterium]|nr:helix-turn-helix transcriptional regulator [Gemmatimonadaceae bacterium]
MIATTTQLDLDRLSRAVSASSSPFDAPTIDDWRADVLRACRDLLDGQMGHFDLFGFGLDDPYLVDGYPPGVFDEWRTAWGAEGDVAIDVTARLNLTVFTRAHRFRVAGDHWAERYKRSRLYTEFYAKHGFLHAGGLYYRSGGTTAYLLVESEALADEAFDDRARRLLRVVEPVFQASIRSLTRVDGGHWTAAALLNALQEPIALVRADGRWMHRSRAFDAALITIPPNREPDLLSAIVRGAADLLAAARCVGARRRKSAERPVRPMWTQDGLSVSLTTLNVPGDPEPVCLVHVVMEGGVGLVHAAAAGLSDREALVAMCLVDGLSNKEIAQRLSISPHTARRHTESILRKLGIPNRTSVARALRGARQPPVECNRPDTPSRRLE